MRTYSCEIFLFLLFSMTCHKDGHRSQFPSGHIVDVCLPNIINNSGLFHFEIYPSLDTYILRSPLLFVGLLYIYIYVLSISKIHHFLPILFLCFCKISPNFLHGSLLQPLSQFTLSSIAL